MSDEYEGNKRREMLWEQMRGNLPPKSTDEVWAEYLRLQKQHISDLEEENERLKQRIKRLEAELEQTKQDRNAIAKNTREPLLLQLDHANERIKRLEEALESIREYWNRDNNNRAMIDACWYAIDTASEALEAKEAKP